MPEQVTLIYIGEKIRKKPPHINDCINGFPIRIKGRIKTISPVIKDNKIMYEKVDAEYAANLVKTSPKLFDFKNAKIKDKDSIDLSNGAISQENIEKREKLKKHIEESKKENNDEPKKQKPIGSPRPINRNIED